MYTPGEETRSVAGRLSLSSLPVVFATESKENK